MISANELKRKAMITIGGELYQVVEVDISLPSARGASTMVHVKLRNFLSGVLQDKTYRASDKFDEADITLVKANFLYKNADAYCFMEQQAFETLELSENVVGDYSGYLYDQLEVKIMLYKDSPVSLELPQYVNLKVVETELSVQSTGNSQGGTKNAILETGKTVRIPQYICAGESICINTETGEVTGRA